METQWVLPPPSNPEIVNLLVREVKLPRALAVILAQRGIDSFDAAKVFFRPDLELLNDAFLMKDMRIATERIIKAIESGEKILVYGDYDVDGTTSVAMMYSFLQELTQKVDYYIPDRYEEGYGISTQGIDYAAENNVSLIIALDCGIKANDKIEYANSKKIDFIICDHHLPGEKLPDAFAVLNPKREDSNFPYKELSGCGVGFKLVQGLSKKLNLPKEKSLKYLDLLAVSIAADIVPIDGENRILAYYGLKKLRESASPGLKELLGKTKKEEINMTQIVFNIAPKINAAGRLEHASQAVELLICKDEKKLKEHHKNIYQINDKRKETDGTVTKEAIQMIHENKEEGNYSSVVYSPNWHKGVLGIVASRLIETFYRPTLVLTSGENGEISGSARSVKGFDIYEVIDACGSLLSRYGGHPFAAGLTMPEENLIAFKEKFESLVKEKIRPTQRKPSIEIDVEIEFSEITPRFLRILKQMEPFGPENLPPVFMTRNLIGGNIRKMGKEQQHLRLRVMDSHKKVFTGIAFGFGQKASDLEYGKFDIVYTLKENHWRGKTEWQLNIKDFRIKE